MFGRKHDLGSGEGHRTSSRAPQDRELARFWRILGAMIPTPPAPYSRQLTFPFTQGSTLALAYAEVCDLQRPLSTKCFRVVFTGVLSPPPPPLPKQNNSLIQTASSPWSYGLLPYGACYFPSHTLTDRRDLAVAYSLAEGCESPKFPQTVTPGPCSSTRSCSDPDFSVN